MGNNFRLNKLYPIQWPQFRIRLERLSSNWSYLRIL